MSDQSEPPTKKRRIEAPEPEDPIASKEELIQCNEDEETELAELSQVLTELRKITRRNKDLTMLLDETLEETRKLKTHLGYLRVMHLFGGLNPIDLMVCVFFPLRLFDSRGFFFFFFFLFYFFSFSYL